MISVARVAMVLFSGVLAAGSRPGVTFERRYTADPCADRVLVFETLGTGVSKIENTFRLNSTDTLFVSRETKTVPSWTRARGVSDLSVELSFLRQQAEVIAKYFRSYLEQSKWVRIYYEFNTETGGYYCYFFLGEVLVSSCKSGTPYYYPALDGFDKYTVARVKRYARGIGIETLKDAARTLGTKWQNFCEMLKALENNATDEYDLRYDEKTGGFVCSIRTGTPWRHLVFFDQTPATETKRSYNWDTDRYRTVGVKNYQPETRIVCNLTFPDGMTALQTFEPRTTTKNPRTTAESPGPTSVETPAFFSTTPLASPSTKETEGMGDESFEPGVGVATIAVPIVLVTALVLGAGLGLFVFRERLAELSLAGFRRVPTRGG